MVQYKIKNRIMLAILTCIALVILILTAFTTWFFYTREIAAIQRNNLLLANNYSQKINTFIQKYTTIAKQFASLMEKQALRERSKVMQMLEETLRRDERILGFCVAYEPNRFDGKDARFAGRPGHDTSGRFIPYWNRLNGKIAVEPLVDMETSAWYQEPKKTKKFYLADPLIYNDVLMVSIDVPILQKEEFLGIVALDLSLETIEKLLQNFDQNKAYPSNYAFLLNSRKDVLISISKPLFKDRKEILKKSLADIAQEKKIPSLLTLARKIKSRKAGYLDSKDLFDSKETTLFYTPVGEKDLTFVVSVSKQDLLNNTKRIAVSFALIGILSILLIAGILYFTINSVVKPLNHLTSVVENFSNNQYSDRATIFLPDEVGKLAQTFNTMADDIITYKDNMEEKVASRTKELNDSFETILKLKKQQDGDYFLTSLLLQPLSLNLAKSDTLSFTMFLRQKKEFSFKNSTYQIGGDICITHTIELQGKKYHVFLNADAMGKSIQGAGGALILGAVFHSIIQRSHAQEAYSHTKAHTPEQWIKAAFKEIHKVFETFDGSMLISLIFGLIEEERQIVYFINAEHPWAILYRDGKANFIEQETNFMKLGTPGVSKNLFISVFPLHPGDSLVIGSDGKDDLLLADGLVNEDETLIFRLIEKTNCNLKEVFSLVSEKYALKDDFSLLSIHCKALDSQEESKSFRNRKLFPDVIQKRQTSKSEDYPFAQSIQEIQSYMARKDYQQAMLLAQQLLQKDESNTITMLQASICFKLTKNFRTAIVLAERVKLREPWNIHNLLHLAEMYFHTENYPRANKLLKRAREQNPKHALVQKLAKKWQHRVD
ncbi:MAG: SpoIIE family protein phosphatase [Spirochaetota bacterium]